jgi:hypothetical protein
MSPSVSSRPASRCDGQSDEGPCVCARSAWLSDMARTRGVSLHEFPGLRPTQPEGPTDKLGPSEDPVAHARSRGPPPSGARRGPGRPELRDLRVEERAIASLKLRRSNPRTSKPASGPLLARASGVVAFGNSWPWMGFENAQAGKTLEAWLPWSNQARDPPAFPQRWRTIPCGRDGLDQRGSASSRGRCSLSSRPARFAPGLHSCAGCHCRGRPRLRH